MPLFLSSSQVFLYCPDFAEATWNRLLSCFLYGGAGTFCPKTMTGSSQSRTPIVPLLFSPPTAFQGCLLPQTKTSTLQYTNSKGIKTPSHYSFLSIPVFFLFGSLRLRLWEEASSFTNSITGRDPLYLFSK